MCVEWDTVEVRFLFLLLWTEISEVGPPYSGLMTLQTGAKLCVCTNSNNYK